MRQSKIQKLRSYLLDRVERLGTLANAHGLAKSYGAASVIQTRQWEYEYVIALIDKLERDANLE